MRRTRSGPSIREFLHYYVLVLLAEASRTQPQLIQEIRRRSQANRSYRPGGVLWVPTAEMDRVLAQLADQGLIKLASRGKWTITWHGRRARRRLERHNQPEAGAKERAADKLLALLEQGTYSSYVLDVGTGQGYLAFKLARAGFRVLGIDSGSLDYSKDSIAKAQEQARSEAAEVEFCQADIRDFDRPDASFDYIVSSQAIHCMQQQPECLKGIHRLLRAGGRFFCIDYLVGLKGFLAHGFHCFLAISREEWTEMLLERGFGNIRMYELDDFLLIEAQKL